MKTILSVLGTGRIAALLVCALLAGLAVGVYESIEDTQKVWQKDLQFDPAMEEFEREQFLRGWHRAVERSLNWIEH